MRTLLGPIPCLACGTPMVFVEIDPHGTLGRFVAAVAKRAGRPAAPRRMLVEQHTGRPHELCMRLKARLVAA